MDTAGGLESHIVEFAMTAIGSAVFGLVGFVWRISHKMSETEKKMEALRELHNADMRQTKRDIDYIMGKVDKHGDKMYCIVRNMKE